MALHLMVLYCTPLFFSSGCSLPNTRLHSLMGQLLIETNFHAHFVNKISCGPIYRVILKFFRYLQNRTVVSVWLYENVNTRIEGIITGLNEVIRGFSKQKRSNHGFLLKLYKLYSTRSSRLRDLL